jgi:hypothetical protein
MRARRLPLAVRLELGTRPCVIVRQKLWRMEISYFVLRCRRAFLIVQPGECGDHCILKGVSRVDVVEEDLNARMVEIIHSQDQFRDWPGW